MKTNSSEIMVKIRITDQSGHTTLEQLIEEAVATTVKQHFSYGKWPFIPSENGPVPFEFTAESINDAEGLLKDTIRLRELLQDYDEPVIVITGPLQGGVR